MNNFFFVALIFLCNPIFSAQDQPLIKFEMRIGGRVTEGTTVSSVPQSSKNYELQLEKEPTVAFDGVKQQWGDTLLEVAYIDLFPVAVKLKVSLIENDNGENDWWTEISFGEKVAGSLGGPNLKGMRFTVVGDKFKSGEKTYEPRAEVIFR